MDIRRSATFLFRDPGWMKKIALGGIFMMLGVFLFGFIIVLGYMMRVLVASLDDRDLPLPKWNDLAGLLQEGIYPFLIGLVYAIPLIMLTLTGAALTLAGMPEAGFVILILILGFAILTSLLYPVAVLRYVITGHWQAAVEFKALFDYVRSNRKVYFSGITAGSMMIVVSMLAGFLVFGIGVVFAAFAGQAMSYHNMGQIYRTGRPFPDDEEAASVRGSFVPPIPEAPTPVAEKNPNEWTF